MMSESTDWAVGCVVMGRFWGDMREPPIKFVIIHRTKHFVTVQRVDDWSDAPQEAPEDRRRVGRASGPTLAQVGG